ncbi:valine--tRNA ligase [Candidatus Gracilibacteria bacterium]|nr:valine--tRNA ligase [Candidatus Gracilibacteria bacterium]
MSDFPKQYDPKIHEPASQALWEEKKIYQPRVDSKNSKQETFYIPIPPPNVTGNLHLGHALTLSIEDIMTRYHRLRGDATLWVPGTDHAGIATQAQVEKRLEKNGTSRKAIGREAFLGECWKWIDEYGGNIQNQVKMMGASVDWDMERFTFDEKNNTLVEKIFVDLYEKGLIYRGEYMVNYSPVLESVISDIEVEHQEIAEHMYYINYFVSGSDKELLIATTRPETLLGDMALAVHPRDKRYKKLIGKSVILPIINREIPIIGDDTIDMEFGTGVVKVTPAHDPSDFEIARRHGLRTDYRVIEKTGLMSAEAGVFAGLSAVGEARDNIVELLRSKGNLVRIEPYTHSVGYCSRGKCRVESVVSTQWFVRASTMAEKVTTGYKKGEFKIVPERFNKTFEDWIYNLRDWCISRQLWWGHQIPAYYDATTGELLGVTRDPSSLFAKYGEQNVRRDDDVLDTWFSSALWPFAVLDWDFENPSEFFQKYYPANVLETGYDILFFWVIRMLLMGYEYTGMTPFRTIYLHGLILDETGKKMSKSWGNVIDPLTVIETYSTDALRLAVTLGNTPGNNMNFSMRSVEENSLFLNKFWNIIRFAWMNVGYITDTRETIIEKITKNAADLLPYEVWILSRLTHITERVTEGMDTYNFASVGSELIAFVRDEFADIAIEAYKVEKENTKYGKDVISLCVLDIITLMHPYIPHITETLYGYITEGHILATASWPTSAISRNIESERNLEQIWEVVRTIRNIRAESGIKPGEYHDTIIQAKADMISNLENNLTLISGLTRVNITINPSGQDPRDHAYGICGSVEIYIHNEIDVAGVEFERERLMGLIEEKRGYIRLLEVKLSNSAFTANAPEKIIRIEMEKKNLAREQLEKLEEKYGKIR